MKALRNINRTLFGRSWLWAALTVAFFVYASIPRFIANGSPGGGTSAATMFETAANALRGRHSSLTKDDALAVWGATFERELRNGNGPLCTPSNGVASHSLVEVKLREELGDFMENVLHSTGNGVELGVQRGSFSREILSRWKSVGQYYLVDPWVKQADFVDTANVDNDEHEKRFSEARSAVAEFSAKGKVTVVRNFSYDARHQFEDCFFDFICEFAHAEFEFENCSHCSWPSACVGM